MSRKYQNILFASIIACIVIVAGALIFGLHTSSVSAYEGHIKEANKLLEQGDFGQAVLKYEEAIDERPNEEEGHLLLVNAYVAAGHKDYALNAVNRGLKRLPKSQKLKEAKERLLGNMETKEKKPPVMAIDLITSFGEKSYQDYVNTNGIEQSKVLGAGEISVRMKNVSAEYIYKNTPDQPHAVEGNTPAPNSLPAEVHLDDGMAYFGGGDSITFEEMETLDLKDLKKTSDQKNRSFVTFTINGYLIEIESDQDGTIKSGAVNTLSIPVASLKSGGSTKVSGVVRDATNNEGIDEVELVFRKSGNADGELEVISGSDGKYEATLGTGEYTVVCKAEGYVEEEKSIYVPTYGSTYNCDLILSPEGKENEARVVLTWGAYPNDLDSYLIGNGVNVNFMNMVAGSTAELDLDDTDGYGPETTTIHDLNGSYTFYVQDFYLTGDIANSGAEVTVYLPGQEPRTISISGSGTGNTWEVFRLDNGVLTVIDEIKDLGTNRVIK